MAVSSATSGADRCVDASAPEGESRRVILNRSRAMNLPLLLRALILLTALLCGPAAAQTSLPSFTADWITQEEFEQQLLKVHGTLPDPNVGLFGPGSMMWEITRYIEPGGLATGRAILMHVSHPWIAQGITDHSKSRHNLLARGRETFSYALVMVYGSREQALAAARDVRGLHNKAMGHMPRDAGAFAKGSEYRANESEAMVWVHATMWESMMIAYELVNGPVSHDDKDRFYEETKLFAYLFGIPEAALPTDWDAMIRFCDDLRASDRMTITPEAKELVDFLYGHHGVLMWPVMSYNKLVTTANISQEMRDAYGFRWGPVRSVFYRGSIDTIRFVHWIMPNYLFENPVQREALARMRGTKPNWFTRLEIRVALGRWSLVAADSQVVGDQAGDESPHADSTH
jgi:uncharacterized protein (DUF2236 family)